MKKGFTLVEIIAVIVILGILAIIIAPNVINVMEKAEKDTFKEFAEGVVRTLTTDADNKGYKGENYSIRNGEIYDSSNSKLNTLGGSNENGIASINDSGKVTLNIYNDKWCATKGYDSSEVEITKYDGTNCKAINLKDELEKDTAHIKKNVKVNGEVVNKVIGKKSEKLTMKNYVWYMGNLWQVLETNDTNNTIKLITAQSITSIAYGETSDYNSSWVKKWLNEVFYKSLEGTGLVKDTTFCLDKVSTVHETITDVDDSSKRQIIKVNSHTPISTCQNKIVEKVGLMSFEDYVYSNNGNTAIYDGGSYLDEDEFEWTLTAYDNSHNWIQWHNSSTKSYITNTINNNNTFSTVKGYGHGVRPVISIDGDAVAKDGDGTKKNPYILLNEKKADSGSKINSVKVGDYIYLDESKNPNKFTEEYVARDLKYTTTKDKVRYRVVKKNSDGTVKVQRSDILRNLPSTIAIRHGVFVPFYYKAGTNGCYYNSTSSTVSTGCENNNIFKVSGNNSEYNYQNSINIGDYLNSSSNGFYNWYSNTAKNMIKETEYDRYTSGYAKDYSNLNNNSSGAYPSKTDDGKVKAKVVLPSWGEMYVANDLNYNYWLLNRRVSNKFHMATISSSGAGDSLGGNIGHEFIAVRPVVTLKSEVKIKDGEGTMTKPYSLYM